MKLIVIDPNVTAGSPSMRAWLQALREMRDLFDRVEIWATHCDLEEDEGLVWKRIPQRFPTSILHGLDFRYRLRKLFRNTELTSDTIIQVTGCTIAQADIRYMHFWNRALLEEQAKRPHSLKLPWKHKITTRTAAEDEAKAVASSSKANWWWVVSRSIAERIEADGAGGQFRIIPNQYDPVRFNLEARDRFREDMRKHYGFASEDKVMVFSAFGHFERKGLMQAVEAVSVLRERGHRLRMLVLGGSPQTLKEFRKEMTGRGVSEDGVQFSGLVDQIEKHLVACDGFFFPSHFEAFSLGEIEAAALGLRLYLTDHYGNEMILRDPVNGRLLPWDVKGMADVIEEDLLSGIFGQTHHELGAALTPDGYRSRLRELYQEVIDHKKRQVSTTAHHSD